MKNQFVTYEIAKKLKELGFTEHCLGAYYDFGGSQAEQLITGEHELHEQFIQQLCLAPLWQQVIDWLEIKHSVFVTRKSARQEFTVSKGKQKHKVCGCKISALEAAVNEALNLI